MDTENMSNLSGRATELVGELPSDIGEVEPEHLDAIAELQEAIGSAHAEAGQKTRKHAVKLRASSAAGTVSDSDMEDAILQGLYEAATQGGDATLTAGETLGAWQQGAGATAVDAGAQGV